VCISPITTLNRRNIDVRYFFIYGPGGGGGGGGGGFDPGPDSSSSSSRDAGIVALAHFFNFLSHFSDPLTYSTHCFFVAIILIFYFINNL
jgi:hypothetical protein